jgi:hypothetical protein
MGEVAMATATVTIPPQAEHVRTARMVTTAAARRCGVPEDRIDEIRLAVGEVIARSVLRQQRAGVGDPVVVDISDDDDLFTVRVREGTPAEFADDDAGVALAVASALAFECDVEPCGSGCCVRLAWPLSEGLLDFDAD